MNYIFDIYINFNKELYDFYEWNDDDKIEFFVKIPIFRIEEEIINNFIYHCIKVDNNFLRKIYNKSQKYSNKTVVNNEYSCILSSNNKCIAISFNDEGYINSRSYLSLEEESEILEFSKFLKYSIINYKIIKKNSFKNNYLTRKENSNIKILNNYLNELIGNKNYEELEYIYYEIYDKKEENYNIIKLKLFNAINNSESKRDKFLKLYNLAHN